jgi:hypothetical protein
MESTEKEEYFSLSESVTRLQFTDDFAQKRIQSAAITSGILFANSISGGKRNVE